MYLWFENSPQRYTIFRKSAKRYSCSGKKEEEKDNGNSSPAECTFQISPSCPAIKISIL
jgi:hypothetical protein